MYRAVTLLTVLSIACVFSSSVQAQQAEMSLVTREAMQEELGIIPEQKEKVDAIVAEYREAIMTAVRELLPISPGMSETDRQRIIDERRKAMLPIGAEHYEKLKAVLNPEQMRRLKEVAIQYGALGSLLVNNPHIAKELELSDDQKERIADTFLNRVGSRGPGRVGVAPAEAQERNEEALAILTDDQRNKLESMKGKPFDLEKLRVASRQRFQGPPFAVFLSRNDKNSDGKIAESEATERFWNSYGRFDTNGDGAVDKDEFAKGFADRPQGLRSGGREGFRDAMFARSAAAVRRPSLGFEEYDEDSDGKLSSEEAGGYWERLAEYDTNQDDALDQKEYAKAQSKVTEQRREFWRRGFVESDTNSDGEVTRKEFEAGDRPFIPAALFNRSDLDSSDALNKEELESFLARGRSRLLPPKGAARGSAGRQQGGQMADPDFDPEVERPAFAEGEGPVVFLDEAHTNYHTLDGRYAPFAKLLRRDGYVVQANSEAFTKDVLRRAKVLVIANAVAEQNQRNWRLPTPSAFTKDEIDVVVKWVSEGGSLLLIADHMPFAGAAQELGSAFDVRFLNGFALPKVRGGAMRFDRENRQLHDHAVTRGRDEREKVDWVSTFTGSAFQISGQFQPILEFGPGVESVQPEVAWQFSDDTPRENVEGWCQAAVGQCGKGHVAVFGEAAMFSAQRAGAQGQQFGMNAPEAAQNAQLLLNTLHWLTGLLDNQ